MNSEESPQNLQATKGPNYTFFSACKANTNLDLAFHLMATINLTRLDSEKLWRQFSILDTFGGSKSSLTLYKNYHIATPAVETTGSKII